MLLGNSSRPFGLELFIFAEELSWTFGLLPRSINGRKRSYRLQGRQRRLDNGNSGWQLELQTRQRGRHHHRLLDLCVDLSLCQVGNASKVQMQEMNKRELQLSELSKGNPGEPIPGGPRPLRTR
jgi:hypothetical protein